MRKILNYKFLLLYSMLQSFCLLYGNLLSKNLSIKDFNLKYFCYFLIISLLVFLFSIFLKNKIEKGYKKNTEYLFSWKKVFVYFIIIILLWIPILLAYYPGIWGYDVASQLPHITNEYSRFNHISSQHPITHTLFLEFFVMIGKLVGNYVLGIFLATITQMIIVSFSLSYCMEKVKTYISNKMILKLFTLGTILFYGLMPFSSLLSISSTKDVLFSIFFIISLLHFYDLLSSPINHKKIFYFLFFSILSSLFKNNYFIIFIITLLSIIVYFRKDILTQKQFLKYGVLAILIFYMIQFSYNIILVPEKTNRWEGMSVPVNTLCHTTKKHPELIEEYMKDGILFDILDIDFIPEDYCFTSLADPMKDFFTDNAVKDFSLFKFMITWSKIGIKYPAEYFDAFSNLNRGAWYLLDESYADVYTGKKSINGYLDTSYFTNLTDKPESKWKWLYDKMEFLFTENHYLDNIFLKIILSPCFYILIVFYFFFLSLEKKDKKMFLFFIPLICLYIGLITGPCTIVRYTYFYMLLVPLLIPLYYKQKK